MSSAECRLRLHDQWLRHEAASTMKLAHIVEDWRWWVRVEKIPFEVTFQ
jgi:hypothetical protein